MRGFAAWGLGALVALLLAVPASAKSGHALGINQGRRGFRIAAGPGLVAVPLLTPAESPIPGKGILSLS
jgi:hypothetical protein